MTILPNGRTPDHEREQMRRHMPSRGLVRQSVVQANVITFRSRLTRLEQAALFAFTGFSLVPPLVSACVGSNRN